MYKLSILLLLGLIPLGIATCEKYYEAPLTTLRWTADELQEPAIESRGWNGVLTYHGKGHYTLEASTSHEPCSEVLLQAFFFANDQSKQAIVNIKGQVDETGRSIHFKKRRIHRLCKRWSMLTLYAPGEKHRIELIDYTAATSKLKNK